MIIVIAAIVVLAIVQLYVSEKLDSTLEKAGLGAWRWTKPIALLPVLKPVDPNPTWPSPSLDVLPTTVSTEEGIGFANLYSGENLSGTRTRAANNDVYVFCEQRGGVKTWNFKSIEAPRNQILCFFSRSRSSGDSSARFVIINRPIRSINSFLEMYPEITRGNTGIMLYGWEHHDLDFVVMPVVESVYRKMLITRLEACHKLCAAWGYDEKETDNFCQFMDPVS
jgi:hypothetical protein